MKTLKSRKRHASVRTRKAASRVDQAIDRKRSIPNVRARHAEANRPIPHGRAKMGYKELSTPVPARPRVDVEYQNAIKNFETGVRAFHKQNYDKAAEIFAKLVDGEARDVAERAHVHLRLCRQRTGRSAPHPKTADDYYTLGVACL